MTDTEKRIAEIRDRAEKATAGPWCWEQVGEKENGFIIGMAIDSDGNPASGLIETSRYDDDADVFVDCYFEHVQVCESGHSCVYSNADFVAHSREDIPFLLAEVEKLRKELEGVTLAYDMLAKEHYGE
jgi:hypothetical protein